MKTIEKTQIPGFLRQEEMNALIAIEGDPITAQIMGLASHLLALRVLRKEKGPAADFDLNYFMELIQELASDHETLRNILEGKGDQMTWLTERGI